MSNSFIFVLLSAIAISGCTTTERRKWVAVGGSKSDGQVILGIDVPAKNGITETTVEYSVIQANQEANRRCKNWGYGQAEIFNDTFPVNVTCYGQGISPCWSKSLRIIYQCIDKDQSN